MTKRKASENVHYVNNADFSAAVVEHVKNVNEAKETGTEPPKVPDYVAMCLLKIAEGLSHKSNFIRYSFREEMVMDAVENCLKAIGNYNVDAATRTGKPNAFSYFTQISWFAFLRRIAKEQRQYEIRTKFVAEGGIEHFVGNMPDAGDVAAVTNFVDQLRVRIDKIKETDQQVKEYKQTIAKKPGADQRTKTVKDQSERDE